MKKLLFILIAISLFISCNMWDEDSDSNVNPLVGTWNAATVKYFGSSNCSGDPNVEIDFNSPEHLALLDLDEYQLQITITIDFHLIVILAQSATTSNVREEDVATGILVDHGNKYCVFWDTDDGDDCDECKDYIINGDELELLSYNCPGINDGNVPCLKLAFVKNN